MSDENVPQKSKPAGYALPLIIALLLGAAFFLTSSPTGKSLLGRIGGDEQLKSETKVMGTLAHITLAKDNPNLKIPAAEAIEKAFAAMSEVDQLMSAFNPASDISRLNSSTVGNTVAVNPLTWAVIMESLRYHRLSGGAFDVTIGPLIGLYDYKSGKMGGLPDEKTILLALENVGSDKIEFRREGMRLGFKREGMKVGLGAIAKGFAVDKAMEKLIELGVENALVEAGGELRLLGKVEIEEPANAVQSLGKNESDKKESKTPAEGRKRPWRSGIRNPRNPMDIIRTIEETDCAIATSGDYEQNFRVGDKVYSHIIDPRSGLPVQGGVVGATVIHPSSCMKADALATTFSVLGEEGTRRFIEKYKDDFGLRGLEVYLYVLDDDGGLSEVHIKVEAALKELQKKNEELQ